MKSRMTTGLGLCLSMLLAACSSVTVTTVGVTASSVAPEFASTGNRYRWVHNQWQSRDPEYLRLESLVSSALARQGLDQANDSTPARYRLMLAYQTQLARVVVSTDTCGGAQTPACVPLDELPPVGWPGDGPLYRHTLNLRFIDSTQGQLAYQVSAALQDHAADSTAAAPLLVQSALARLPFAAGPGWRVHNPLPQAAGHTGAAALPGLTIEPAGR